MYRIDNISLSSVAEVLLQIPELDRSFDIQTAATRLGGSGLLLGALDHNGAILGFKLGYDRYRDGSFYSWLGGVVPAERQQGVAQGLLQEQERRVQDLGFCGIYVKTRNKFVGMRVLLAKEGYQVVSLSAAHTPLENRLLHYKAL